MRSKSVKVMSVLAGGLILAGFSGHATAQQQADTGGRALDANPQVGSGGANQPRQQMDFRSRNDIITGNVGGGAGFRGQVDYSAPGDFRAPTGADDLFDFRARSLPGQPGQPPQSVYRDYGGPSVPGAGSWPDQFDVGGHGPRPSRPGQVFPDRMGDRDPFVGRGLDAPMDFDTGGALFIMPEVGPFDGASQWDAFDGGWVGDDDLFEEGRFLTHPHDLLEWEEDRSMQRLDRLQTQLYADPFYGTAPSQEQAGGMMHPSLMIGQQMAQRRDGRMMPGRSYGEQIEQIERRMFERLDERRDIEPGQDVYRDRLARLQRDPQGAFTFPEQRRAERARQMVEQEEQRLAAMPEWQREHEEHLAALQQEREQMGEQAWQERVSPLDEPDADELADIEQQRQAMLERLMGEQDDALPRPWDQWEAEDEAELEEDERTLAEFLDRLAQEDLPRIETMVGTQQTRVNQILASAEADMAEGLYFEAETSYRQVIDIDPGEALARAGLVHAQLGAGMIHSATLNLREMFQRHPEMIGTRYEPQLLPSEERLRWMQGELQRMMQAGGENSADAALLLAYLGHQTESRQLVRFGLARAETVTPDDPLLPLLRRVWLGDEQAGQVGDGEELELMEQK